MASSRQLEAARLNVRAARRSERTSASGQPAKDARRDPGKRGLTEPRRPRG